MTARIDPARSLVGLALLASLGSLAACGDGEPEAGDAGRTAADAPPPPHAGQALGSDGGAMTIAGITYTPPAAWESLGASGMRKAQYRLAPRAGDDAPAEVNVFYFGPNSGGGVEANLQRWIGQMDPPPGEEPVRSEFTADGMTGHTVSLDGTYGAGGMRPMGGAGEPKPGYRLVGVVLEGPEGSVFFKLTGPAATARAMEDGLLAMVAGARRAG